MNQPLKVFILALLFAACKNEVKQPETPEPVQQKTLTGYSTNHSSMRAIEIIDVNHVAFAGSRGDVGVISEQDSIVFKQSIKYDTIIPHFRSLAYVKENIFALAVGNPALLYKVTENSVELVYEEHHPNVFYDSMHFFDDVNGIAMGDSIEGCLSIILTNDSGESWTKIPCENLPPSADGENAFAASDTNISIYKDHVWIATGGKKARVFHSANKGKDWEVYDTPIIQGIETTGIYSIDFYDELSGIICGGDFTNKFGDSANKAITKDGGKTWTLVGSTFPPKYVSCVQYIPNSDAKEIIAVSTNGVFKSSNGGLQWAKIEEEGFYTVRVVDNKTFWLAGANKIKKMRLP